jgi:hypothetical protein
MQAGLTCRALTLREVFSSRMVFLVEECPIRALLLDPSGHLRCSESGSGSLATIDDGSTPYRRLPPWKAVEAPGSNNRKTCSEFPVR